LEVLERQGKALLVETALRDHLMVEAGAAARLPLAQMPRHLSVEMVAREQHRLLPGPL
jgi:hypothetical protein